jgi:signal transduction histidine kinase
MAAGVTGISLLRLHAHMKDISILIDADDAIYGYADKEMIEFIVRNLISNAIKFSHRNNEVLVKANPENGAITIEVKDAG